MKPTIPLLTLLMLSCPTACTVIKPVVCTFSYPIDNIRERLAAPESDDDEDLPPVLILLTAPVIVPLRFVSEAAIGFVGGFFSGFASDLNVVTWNFSSPARNLAKPFKTNARKRAD